MANEMRGPDNCVASLSTRLEGEGGDSGWALGLTAPSWSRRRGRNPAYALALISAWPRQQWRTDHHARSNTLITRLRQPAYRQSSGARRPQLAPRPPDQARAN